MNARPVEDATTPDVNGDDEWEIIHRYTRAQALEDGALVDVSETARQAGIRYPVALSRAVWKEYVELNDVAKRAGNDEKGRLWDVVWMLRHGILQNRHESCFLFQLYVVTDAVEPSLVTLKAMCGPGDDGEPVITVLEPEED
jgi:hypothetical protein